MLQLLIRDSGRGWQFINTDPKLVQAVSAADVMRVANTYFTPENRTVAIYYTKKSGRGEADPLLQDLDDQEKQMVQQMKAQVGSMSKEQAQQALQQMEQQASQVPADKRKLFQAMRRILETRLQPSEGEK